MFIFVRCWKYSTLNKYLMILNAFDIVQMRIMNIEDLKFDHVIMIYIPKIWNNDLITNET